jgi:23S rRNA (uracil1939-C5)-methyltransferase
MLGPMDSLRLHEGQVVELSVNNLALGGAGIARIDAFIVFLTGGVPSDVVKARLTEFTKRHAGACAVGGCMRQSLAHALQLDYKTRQVRESS